jgi:transcriptional regulator with XRE-family HTH domain
MEGFNIAQMLKDMRKYSGISVADCAAQLQDQGFSKDKKTIYGYESGLSMPNGDVFLAMCKIYGAGNPLTFYERTKEDREKEEIWTAYKALPDESKRMIRAALGLPND